MIYRIFRSAALALGGLLTFALAPASAAFLSFNQVNTGSISGGIATWSIGSLSYGGSSTYTISNSNDYLIATLNTSTDLFTIKTNGTANNFGLGNSATIYSGTTTLSGSSPNFTFSDLTAVALDPTFFGDLQTAGFNNVLPAGIANSFTLSGTTSGVSSSIISSTVNLTSTPEPSAWLLMGAGLMTIVMLRRRKVGRPAVVSAITQ